MSTNVWTAAGALLSLGALHGLGVVLPSAGIRWGAAAMLVGLGVWQSRGHRHVGLGRWRVGGLQASGRELTAWSFIVATAHGAGLMAAPFALRALQSGATGHLAHASHSPAAVAGVVSIDWPTLWATGVHTAGYLLVTALLAVVIYERAALHLVRRAWINFDLVWAGALVLTGVAVAVV